MAIQPGRTVAAVGTPEWWLRRLGKRLDDRRVPMTRAWRYYHGQHNVKLISEEFRANFASRFPEFADNFMPLVVDTESNRLEVQGIRFGTDSKTDDDAWAWWQENQLDAESKIAHKDALMKGIVNVLVWPDAAGEPVVTIEDALQTVVEVAPGQSRKRRAAMKRWVDDDGTMVAELYLPDRVLRYRTRQRVDDFSATWAQVAEWQPTTFSGIGSVINRIGVVPIVPLVNRPCLSRISDRGDILPYDDGESELDAVLNNQDYINAYRMMAIVQGEFASFRQRWILNLELPLDPETKKPIRPFRPGVDHLWVIPPAVDKDGNLLSKNDAPPVTLGDFDQSDPAPLVGLIREEVGHLASKSRTPYHYFLGQSQTVPPSGESLKSSETALVSKTEDAEVSLGEGWEEAFRLNFLWRSDTTRGRQTRAEIRWKDAESRNEAALADTLTKLKTLGVEDEFLQEMFGLSPQQIERNRDLKAARLALEAASGITEVSPTDPLDTNTMGA